MANLSDFLVGYKKKYRPPPQSKCEKCGVEITSFQGYQNHMRVHQFGNSGSFYGSESLVNYHVKNCCS